MKKKSLIDPKNLIIDSLKSQLENDNIQKMILNLSLHDNNYSVHIKPAESNKVMVYKMERSEITMIKRMFVSKIKHKIQNPENYKSIMLVIDLNKDDFELYLYDNNSEVTKFEI